LSARAWPAQCRYPPKPAAYVYLPEELNVTGGAAQLLVEQAMNGLQLGIMLFLIAGGLTLVLGIMNLLNLTHGSFYMLGAYIGIATYGHTREFLPAVAGAILGTVAVAAVAEVVVMRRLYDRDHLGQLLATFGLLLFINEMVTVIWGTGALQMARPEWLRATVDILPGVPYPSYRLAITCVGLAVTLLLQYGSHRTRIGMLIRAGANNKRMLGVLGVNVDRIYAVVFCLGVALAALAGVMVAPLVSVDSGMGDSILILCFVVVTIGGMGSVRGAFIASLLVGLVDTFGQTYLPQAFGYTLGPALSSMSIYALMALVLLVRPEGLFPTMR
jgi:branched-chain amino acid transport system permease protein